MENKAVFFTRLTSLDARYLNELLILPKLARPLVKVGLGLSLGQLSIELGVVSYPICEWTNRIQLCGILVGSGNGTT